MAITHPVAQRNRFADDVDAQIGATGRMVLRDGGVEVATMPLNNPAFGAASGGTITLDNAGPPEDSNATGGDVDTFDFDDGSTVIFSGVVGDITLTKNPIDNGDTVQLTSFTYTASP